MKPKIKLPCDLYKHQIKTPTHYVCNKTKKLFPYNEYNKERDINADQRKRLPKNDPFISDYSIIYEIKPKFLCCQICDCFKMERIADENIEALRVEGYKPMI